jgi:hypothetical protein
MGGISITRVYFDKELPSAVAILRAMLVEASIHANLSIERINSRKEIDEIYADSGIIILNKEIIRYSLWKEGCHAVGFSLIEEQNKKYIEIGDAPFLKTLASALVYTLVCLGTSKIEKQE